MSTRAYWQSRLPIERKLSELLCILCMFLGSVGGAFLGVRLLSARYYISFLGVAGAGGLLGYFVGFALVRLARRTIGENGAFRIVRVIVSLTGVPFALDGAYDLHIGIANRSWASITSSSLDVAAAVGFFAMSGLIGTGGAFLWYTLLLVGASLGTVLAGDPILSVLPLLVLMLGFVVLLGVLNLKGRKEIV